MANVKTTGTKQASCCVCGKKEKKDMHLLSVNNLAYPVGMDTSDLVGHVHDKCFYRRLDEFRATTNAHEAIGRIVSRLSPM